MGTALMGQDHLTTVISQAAGASSAPVTGSMVGFLPVGEPAAILKALAAPTVRIVSLTVTEGGSLLDAEGRFDPTQKAVAAGAAVTAAPSTVFGLLARALGFGRKEDKAPFAVMYCDNISHNGSVARGAVSGTARLWDAHLADIIAREVAFPNAMVDRITPATGERERAMLSQDFGIEDAVPVFCEDFSRWVLEDTFPRQAVPPWRMWGWRS